MAGKDSEPLAIGKALHPPEVKPEADAVGMGALVIEMHVPPRMR